MLLPRSLTTCATRPAISRSIAGSKFSKSLHAQLSRRYASTPPIELKKTALHDLHVANGAKMVPFAGYSMPVTYSDQGLSESHNFVRSSAGLFDVSHMVQHRFKGPGALEFLQTITPSDLTTLQLGQSTLSVFLNPLGGIVDDLMITMLNPEDFYVVTNAACAVKDLEFIAEYLERFPKSSDVHHEVLEEQGLVALQGPSAKDVLQEFLVRAQGTKAYNLTDLLFGFAKPLETPTFGAIQVARGGYTGEDGFEISISPDVTEEATKTLLNIGEKMGGKVKLTGLGARDSLRLEAGMCLYGHDLDESTTPIEAGLKWLVGKRRVMEGGFNGHAAISRQYNDWKLVERRRVGFVVEGAPAREGAELLDNGSGESIGKITSGCPSPTLGKNIAMGYIKSGFHKSGTEVGVKVRGKVRKGVVTKMPFVPAKYYKGPGVPA